LRNFEFLIKYLIINTIGDVNQLLDYLISIKNDQVSDRVGDRAGDRVGEIIANNISNFSKKILVYCLMPKKREDIFKKIGITYHLKNFNNHIKPLLALNWLEMTIPDKPSSPKQRYRNTAKGKVLLKILNE